MSSSTESPNLPTPESLDNELADSRWLTQLSFRRGAAAELKTAARQGDATIFVRALAAAHDRECRIGKRERVRLLQALSSLWTLTLGSEDTPLQQGSLGQCLFDHDLTIDERSGRVEAILTSMVEGTPDRRTLVEAHWLLRLAGGRLEPDTQVALFRWTLESTHTWLAAHPASPADDSVSAGGCEAFDRLELQLLSSLLCPGLKGARKSQRQAVREWRQALDGITETDGTPHGRLLPEVFSRLCQLAATTLFADALNQSLWDRKSHRRLEGLLARSALLLSPSHVAFQSADPRQVCSALLTVAEVLHLSARPGLLSLLAQWEAPLPAEVASKGTPVRGKLPRVSMQSDWADWGCLRSAWPSPVDNCVLRHSGGTPELDVVAADHPLIAGEWSHQLTVDGQATASTGEWGCCCWYLDRQAAFMELQLDRENQVQVIRQALLLREESVLLLANSVRLPHAANIEFSQHLPFVGGWSCEEDSTTREMALMQPDARVRLFPWSSPQMRIDRSDETITFSGNQLQTHTRHHGHSLYSAVLFDWSGKRREEPVDWQRVTVAEDGQIITPDVAVGYRLRIGKKQWLVYHSHRKPVFPRSVLGVHTLNETVFGKLSPSGDFEVLVEVEL